MIDIVAQSGSQGEGISGGAVVFIVIVIILILCKK